MFQREIYSSPFFLQLFFSLYAFPYLSSLSTTLSSVTHSPSHIPPNPSSVTPSPSHIPPTPSISSTIYSLSSITRFKTPFFFNYSSSICLPPHSPPPAPLESKLCIAVYPVGENSVDISFTQFPFRNYSFLHNTPFSFLP